MNQIKIYNSLNSSLEDFQPVNKPFVVGLYTCGPTVYGFTHIGHLRTYIFEDILKRNFIFNGYLVEHVMNITDVGHLTSDSDTGDDKIEKQAKKENKTASQIAHFYTKDFFWNLKKLNILKPSITATVTGHIQEQINLIKKLEEKGYTYKTSDGLYLDTSKIPEYKTLFNQTKENLKADERITNIGEKRNPADFAVWKFSSPTEKRQMEWKSPWGIGFPGWHTECVAIATKYLGNYFDIHCGGADHIPVHHPNEIAQSLAVNNTKLSKYWMHIGFLLKDSEKMSKSSGNFSRLIELIEQGFYPLAFRYFVLNTYYRKTTDFSTEALSSSQNALLNLYEFINKIKSLKKLKLFKKNLFCIKKSNTLTVQSYQQTFFEQLNNDLNTPKSLETLWNLVNEINKNLYQFEPSIILKTFKSFDQILGLNLITQPDRKIPLKIKCLAWKRNLYKKYKKFAKADELRDIISKAGFQINDYKNFYTVAKQS